MSPGRRWPKIEPQHDAPVCPDCEGPLVPLPCLDGTAIHPRDLMGATFIRIPGWDHLRCVECGFETKPDMTPVPVLFQAWYSVGAAEQSRWMKVPRPPGGWGLDVITECVHCPCLYERIDPETGNDVLACSSEEDIELDREEVFDGRHAECPRVGSTATWPEEKS